MKKPLLVAGVFWALAAAAQTVASYISKGNEYYLRLEFETAEAQYRKALEKDPRSAEARYNLGNALMQQRKYKAALEMYEGLVTENRTLKVAGHYNAGVSYTKQKDLPNGIEAYKAALRINPDDKEARDNLQKALFEQRRQQNKGGGGGGGGGMNQNDADQKLKELADKERQLQKKMRQGGGEGQGGGKDW